MFLEYVEHLLLLHHLFQYIRVLLVGDAQQQTVVVFHDVEQPDEAGAGKQIAIIVVDGIAQRIIIGIERTRSFQQLHLIFHASLTEDAYGFSGMAFDAMVGDIFGDNLLHPFLDGSYIFQFDGTADAQIAKIALGYGVLHKQLSFGKQFADSFVKDET